MKDDIYKKSLKCFGILLKMKNDVRFQYVSLKNV